jgi:hypothetical protein
MAAKFLMVNFSQVIPLLVLPLSDSNQNKNGFFTRALIQEIQLPGLSIDRVVKNVRNKVAELAKSVGHEQMLGEFYFRR